jgi:hypothetical protein
MWVAAAYQQRLILILPRIAEQKSSQLTDRLRLATTVVAGDLPTRFAEVAAAILVEEIIRIAKQKVAKKQPAERPDVCLAIVSGTTNRRIIKQACAFDWKRDLSTDLAALDVKFKIFPLNMTLLGAESSGGNAAILCHILAEKITAEGGTAEAYGLTADPIVPKDQLAQVDTRFAQTRTVLEYTEPHRVDPKMPPQSTKLDLVLTGVGQKPDPEDISGGSIFYQLMKDNEFHTPEPIVGDLAFNPLSPDGEPAKLVDSTDKEFVFYAAVSLKILEAMAKDPSKAVILVAQSKQQQDKWRVILASTRALNHERPRYVSRLVIDEPTALQLLAFL